MEYRRRGLESNKQEIALFTSAVAKGLYPKKCLACYIAGIRWCRYWNKSFHCEEYEESAFEAEYWSLFE
jgi:hypothetical protein